jgi:hypothetical protein
MENTPETKPAVEATPAEPKKDTTRAMKLRIKTGVIAGPEDTTLPVHL